MALSFLAWTALLPALSSASFGSFLSNGQTQLTGSSFGLPGSDATFDYVVVGGGTAGLVMARRLAEIPKTSVAVIEAGGFYESDNGNISQIPAFDTLFSSPDPAAPMQSLVDWEYVTAPQAALNNRQLHYTQGKTFGGRYWDPAVIYPPTQKPLLTVHSSARNYMAYHRGTLGSYQMWANQVGDQSYTFPNLLKHFQHSTHFTPPNQGKIGGGGASYSYDENVFSASGGPLHVSYSNYQQPFTRYVQKGLQAIGLSSIAGLNSGKLLGFSFATVTIDPKDETRSSSETSFLQAAIVAGTNLQIYKNTLAKRINFNAAKKATSVTVNTAGKAYALSAKKEVIVSAGLYNSPQLLMVSGIGPKTTLQKHGIPVISDLAGVGQNSWDQPYFSICYRVNVTTASAFADPSYASEQTQNYLDSQTGPLTSVGGDIIGWEKIPPTLRAKFTASTKADLAAFPADWPEIEHLAIAAPTVPVSDLSMYASFTVAVVAPLSKGNMTIASADTSDKPIISPNFLQSPTDQQVAVAGFRRARQLAAATGIIVDPEYYPGPQVQTDAQILEVLRESTGPIHHGSATCRMGKISNRMAVVNSKAQVFGVSGLRVVDVSAFPFTPPGHTQASVYMLAEKIAAGIKSGLW